MHHTFGHEIQQEAHRRKCATPPYRPTVRSTLVLTSSYSPNQPTPASINLVVAFFAMLSGLASPAELTPAAAMKVYPAVIDPEVTATNTPLPSLPMTTFQVVARSPPTCAVTSSPLVMVTGVPSIDPLAQLSPATAVS
jgi:hypothetical protein